MNDFLYGLAVFTGISCALLLLRAFKNFEQTAFNTWIDHIPEDERDLHFTGDICPCHPNKDYDCKIYFHHSWGYRTPPMGVDENGFIR